MAGNYTVVASQSTVEVLDNTTAQDVLEITAQAQPSGVVYSVRFPPVIADPDSIAGILGAWAPGVVAVQFTQNINAANQLVDGMAVTVSSSSGRMQFTRYDIPLTDTVEQWQQAVAETRAQLDAIESR
jgi:hypothetical protein